MLGDAVLYESLDATLFSLGKHTRDLVISTFKAKHVMFRPQSLDAEKVGGVLYDLFGMGSGAIMISAYDRLNRRLAIGFDDSLTRSSVEKIRKWLEVNGRARYCVAGYEVSEAVSCGFGQDAPSHHGRTCSGNSRYRNFDKPFS